MKTYVLSCSFLLVQLREHVNVFCLAAFYWFSYENMKTYVLLTRGSTDMTYLESFSAGAFSGTVRINKQVLYIAYVYDWVHRCVALCIWV